MRRPPRPILRRQLQPARHVVGRARNRARVLSALVTEGYADEGLYRRRRRRELHERLRCHQFSERTSGSRELLIVRGRLLHTVESRQQWLRRSEWVDKQLRVQCDERPGAACVACVSFTREHADSRAEHKWTERQSELRQSVRSECGRSVAAP